MTNAMPNVALILISILSISKSAAGDGFTTDLIHRDSPQSPSYDPSLTPSQLIANAIRRSSHRLQLFSSNEQSQNSPQSELVNTVGEFLVKFSVGSPPVPALGIVDTGSDLTWTQCQPCLKCFNQTVPFFEPRNSSTYKKIRCDAPVCKSFLKDSCSNVKSSCRYFVGYGDGSFTQGDLSRETITFAGGKGAISIPKVVIGCGTENGGLFSGKESGIFGLGGGNESMVHQLGPVAGGKFAYCLVPFLDRLNSSKLSFGADAVVSGGGVVSTPLAPINKTNTYYMTTLLGISVGNQRFGGEGGVNILVDSGTTLTLLPSGMYDETKSAMERAIKLRKVADPTQSLDLCFETRNEIVIPDMRVHFKGGDLMWKAENAFVRLRDDVVCLAARPTDDLAIYGNFAQANFLVGFDLVKGTVSFKPADCGKL